MLIYLRKTVLTVLLAFSLTFVCYAENAPEVSASSAVLIDGDTLEILYAKNAESQRSMASTTKIMTALIAVESGKLGKTVTVKEKPYIEGTAIGFDKGDRLTLETLCYAMLLESGNDAAVLTAQYLAGSEEQFSVMMNRKAAEIGMVNTNFVTASGLDDDEHYTTAYDMALLGAYAIKNSKLREICGTKSYKAEFIEPEKVRYFSNHNRLLSSCEGVIGLKTGFTKKSGRCLVSACVRNGKLLVAVTLNAPDDWNDHKKLYSYGYSLYEVRELNASIPEAVRVYGSDISSVESKAEGKLYVSVLKGSELEAKIYINSFLYAPVKKYDCIGRIVYLQNGCEIAQQPIVSLVNADTVEGGKIYKPSIFRRIADFFKLNKRKVE